MDRWNAAGIVVLLVVSAVAAALFVPVDAAPPGDVSFDDTTFAEQRGDRIYVPITFETGSIAKLTIFGPGYDAELNVRDADDDGRVVVVINSYRAGDPVEAYRPLDSGDEIGASQLFREADTLPTGRYDLRLSTDSHRDRASLVVEERRTDGVRVLRASATAAGDLESVDDVDAAIDDGAVSPLAQRNDSRTVAAGDALVVSVDGTGFGGALTAPKDGDVGLLLNRTSPCLATDGLLDGRESTVLVDSDSDRYYVVVDTAALDLEPLNATGGNCAPTLSGDDRAAVELQLPASSTLTVDGSENATTEPFAVATPTASLDDSTLRAGTNQSVSGSTVLAPGTELAVTVEGAGVDETTAATVDADGRFDATVDLTAAERFANLTVTVTTGGDPVTGGSRTAVVGADTPAVRLGDQTVGADASTLDVDLASLPEGGFVVLEHDGDVLGASTHEEGVVRDLAVPFENPPSGTAEVRAVAYRDANGNGEFDDADQPYTAAGESPAADATVEFPAVTTTETQTTTTATPGGRGGSASGNDLVGLLVAALLLGGPLVLALREG